MKNPDPLQPENSPNTLIERENEAAQLKTSLTDHGRNILITGPRGTGKTVLLHQQLSDLEKPEISYINCDQNNTQYKVLKQICSLVTGEPIGSGHHTSDLQREIQERTGHTPLVIVLDEIDFLLLNDGNDLLYYLSRLKPQLISLVLVSANHLNLEGQVDERTYSSLQPERLAVEPYTINQTYSILEQRARDSLKPRSLYREALTQIASTTQNIKQGLIWLETSAKHADKAITQSTVQETRSQAHQRYVDHMLETFSHHHLLLYQGITELETESEDSTVTAGKVYTRYRELCEAYSTKSVSTRRLSDFLKHLEMLNLIQAEYHYGGSKGKTREVQLEKF